MWGRSLGAVATPAEATARLAAPLPGGAFAVVHLAPQVALHEVARLAPALRDRLRGAVITLKLDDWAFVDELPAFAARIAALGVPDVRLRRLPSNRRELCAVATRG